MHETQRHTSHAETNNSCSIAVSKMMTFSHKLSRTFGRRIITATIKTRETRGTFINQSCNAIGQRGGGAAPQGSRGGGGGEGGEGATTSSTPLTPLQPPVHKHEEQVLQRTHAPAKLMLMLHIPSAIEPTTFYLYLGLFRLISYRCLIISFLNYASFLCFFLHDFSMCPLFTVQDHKLNLPMWAVGAIVVVVLALAGCLCFCIYRKCFNKGKKPKKVRERKGGRGRRKKNAEGEDGDEKKEGEDGKEDEEKESLGKLEYTLDYNFTDNQGMTVHQRQERSDSKSSKIMGNSPAAELPGVYFSLTGLCCS
ncbi:hypothetical protein JOB18_023532 [Solea senegalensis]|uniref:Uncharacterized protein n=1 Tax=Solea senegalensis TaxID=28829 RepID=A0AAV6RLD6_SOLSE|nr:hypothetical protein JOB18_023532 [Solea senegalensis]